MVLLSSEERNGKERCGQYADGTTHFLLCDFQSYVEDGLSRLVLQNVICFQTVNSIAVASVSVQRETTSLLKEDYTNKSKTDTKPFANTPRRSESHSYRNRGAR